jgi:hypothetical protein
VFYATGVLSVTSAPLWFGAEIVDEGIMSIFEQLCLVSSVFIGNFCHVLWERVV